MSLKIDRGVVLRNTLINLLGAVAPMAVSVLTLPRVLAVLGAERYGVLSLALVAVGYFQFLEFGLGGAATKYISEALGRGDEAEIPSIVWTSALGQVLLGALGGLLLAALAPLLAGGWLKVAPALQGEVRSAMVWLSLAIPLIFAASTFGGALEAAQRFDLANAVAVPASAAMSVAIYVGASGGLGLPGIVGLMVFARALIAVALFLIAARLFPSLLRSFSVSAAMIRKLLGFGAWSTIGGLVIPILMYSDRFFLGRYASLADVTYYAVPYALMMRLLVVPSSLVRALFPAFSSLGASSQEDLEDLFLRSLKYIALASGPLLLLLAAFGRELFAVWLGADMALRCAPVFQILLYGTVFAMLAPIPATLLQGVGRPDLVVKWYVVCVPLNTLLVWALVRAGGAAGAAWSFTVRAAAEALVFTFFAARIAGIPYASLSRHRIGGLIGALSALCVMMLALSRADGVAVKGAECVVAVAFFVALSWSVMLDESDRSFIRLQLRARLRST